jgi:hypothetical protein
MSATARLNSKKVRRQDAIASERDERRAYRRIKGNGGHVQRSDRVRFIQENAEDCADYDLYDDTDNLESVMI